MRELLLTKYMNILNIFWVFWRIASVSDYTRLSYLHTVQILHRFAQYAKKVHKLVWVILDQNHGFDFGINWDNHIHQGCQNYGPCANCGPPSIFNWPVSKSKNMMHYGPHIIFVLNCIVLYCVIISTTWTTRPRAAGITLSRFFTHWDEIISCGSIFKGCRRSGRESAIRTDQNAVW